MKKKSTLSALGLLLTSQIFAQGTEKIDYVAHFGNGLFGTIIYSFIGLLMVVIAFKVIDKLTPGDFANQIANEKNVALAIVYGASILGICIIIAAAIAG